jgi:hypothetical protein
VQTKFCLSLVPCFCKVQEYPVIGTSPGAELPVASNVAVSGAPPAPGLNVALPTT